MGAKTSKTIVFDPVDYVDVKKDTGITLENYILRQIATEYDVSKMAVVLKKPIDTLCALIRMIHQHQESVKPILFELFESKGEILARLKKYPAA
jgi:hypothetical protein